VGKAAQNSAVSSSQINEKSFLRKSSMMRTSHAMMITKHARFHMAIEKKYNHMKEKTESQGFLVTFWPPKSDKVKPIENLLKCLER
jgi:hypothetical protein